MALMRGTIYGFDWGCHIDGVKAQCSSLIGRLWPLKSKLQTSSKLDILVPPVPDVQTYSCSSISDSSSPALRVEERPPDTSKFRIPICCKVPYIPGSIPVNRQRQSTRPTVIPDTQVSPPLHIRHFVTAQDHTVSTCCIWLAASPSPSPHENSL